MTQPAENRCPTCGETYPESARFCTNDGTALVQVSSNDPLIGTRLDGRYLVLRKLGEGGMGVVYAGVQLSIDREVAIKVIRNASRIRQRDRQRLWVEARAISRLEHPNVVRVYDCGTGADDAPFLVMELLRGRSVFDAIEQDGLPLDAERATWIVAEAARGLAAAHRQGLVHRDIKPSNLWLQDEEDPRACRVKVLDFGLVTDGGEDSRLTRPGDVLGTPAYMSPEQINGTLAVTPAMDVYGLGALLFELLVGRLVFEGTSTIDILAKQLSAPPPDAPFATDGRPIPEHLRAVWARALAKDPGQRYPDAAAMLDDLVGPGSDGPVSQPAAVSGAVDVSEFPTQDVSDAARSARIGSRGSRDLSRERKRVVLLSVKLEDLPGQPATDLEERLELVGDRLDDWAEGVLRRGGLAGVVVGHCVHGTYGLPTAHEDDAMNALEAALAIVEQGRDLSSVLALQVGIHTASMVAEIDPESDCGYRLVGDPFEHAELAAAAGAPAGGMPVLTGPVYRTLQRSFHQSLPVVAEVKGDTVHQVVGGRSALVSLDAEAPRSRLVGRDRELASMSLWVSDAISQRSAGLRLVVGDAGLGKTRLLGELAYRLRRDQPDVQRLRAPAGQRPDAPFELFRALLLGAAGGADRIGRWVTETLSERSRHVGVEPVREILRLVGLADRSNAAQASSPQGRRTRGLSALADLFGALAARGGVAVLADDLHEADSASLEAIDYLLAQLADFPIVFVGFARGRSSLIQRHPPSLELEPLPEDRARELVRRSLGEATLGRQRLLDILARGGGNPLFLEELARDAVAPGRSGELPESLHAMLRARFDAMPQSNRTVLQHAAIVGPTFWPSAVSAQVAGGRVTRRPLAEVLDDLRRAGFVTRAPHSLYAGEPEWRFAQRMMREVAYEACLRRRRREGHGAVARWLDERGPEQAPAHYPLIADHFERAGELEAAAAHWRQAGERARERQAYEPAARAFARALDLGKHWSAEALLELRLDLGIALQLVGETDAAAARLREVVDDGGARPDQRIDALVLLARMAGFGGRQEERTALLEEAAASSAGASSKARVGLAVEHAWGLMRRGDYEQAHRLAEEALRDVEPTGEDRERLAALANLHTLRANLAKFRGDALEAVQAARAALAASERCDNAPAVAAANNLIGLCLRDLGRHDEAAAAARESARWFHDAGIRVHEAMACLNHGWSRLEGGFPLRARQIFHRLRSELEGELSWTVRALLDVGDARAADEIGLREEAVSLAERSLETAGTGAGDDVVGWVRHSAGVVLRDPALLDEAVGIWRRLDRPAELARSLDARRALVENGPEPGEGSGPTC